MDDQNFCLEIKNAVKIYRSRNSNFHVINGLTLLLPHGTIYGLLGPSGCGKTTLLRCIMGRLGIDAGFISVFGNSPGFDGSKSLIGYMPQETALINNLTVVEILRLYGNIHGMPTEEIKTRSEFLIKLLKIPYKRNSLLCQLSGGQKRRTSFAIALLHSPKLLILDEPTVGVEPVLRQNIWGHLASLAKSQNTSIIITTHYIEEARMAHCVGMMLNGQLLANAPPETLIQHHKCQSLEQAFLNISLKSKILDVDFSKKESQAILKQNTLQVYKSEMCGKLPVRRKWVNSGRGQRVKSLLMKNILQFIRTPVMIVIQLLIPSVVMFLYSYAIGKPLFNLSIGVVNHDKDELGDLFLNYLDTRTLIQVPYSDFEDAKRSTKEGALVSAIDIGPNFTNSITVRYRESFFADDVLLNDSLISIFMDDSNQFVSFTVLKELHEGFFKFIEEVLVNKWGMNPRLAEIPLKIADKQVYGSPTDNLNQFIIPAFLLSTIYILAVALTAIVSFNEKASGSYERAILAGVSFFDITLSDILSQCVLMPIQIILMLLTAVLICGVTCQGSYILVVLLILFQGFTGCCFGVLLSYSSTTAIATALLLAQFMISLIMDGFLFPVETLPSYLRLACELGILKYPVQAVRDIMNRGWSLAYAPVLLGFVTNVAWSSVFFVLSYVLFRIKK